jgi:translation initiation factor 2 subunit 2
MLDEPALNVMNKSELIMIPAQVIRVGTKTSLFSNFSEICKMLHQQPKHLLDFILSELGTTGSLDSNNQLIIKGRFMNKQIEIILRRYIKKYVMNPLVREEIPQNETF